MASLSSAEPPSTLFIGSDHAGYQLKNKIVEHVKSRYSSIKIQDSGSHNGSKCDYPDISKDVCEKLLNEEKSKPEHKSMAILICGSGIGISIAANKFGGIRCALCHNVYTAQMSRCHNNANILAMGERVIDHELALQLVDTFFNTGFEGNQHTARVAKIDL